MRKFEIRSVSPGGNAQVLSGVSAGVILIYDLVRVLTGAASEADLVAVRESEEL